MAELAELASSVWRVVSDPGSPLVARDRVLVPLVTALSVGLSGLSPEQMVGAALATVAALALALATLGCFRRAAMALAALAALGAVLAVALLAEKSVPQTGPYGVLPLQEDAAKMPRAPAVAERLVTEGPFFRDEAGRALLLRGVNLGGDSKVPTSPEGATWRREGFFDKEVSFVGRPFPLEEADEHLARLQSWGFTFLRFLVTWEAVEHAGPGQYDLEYLEYVRQVVRKCREHEISVFVDPHQDVWSRWTGGDGAPAWTLTKVGFDIEALNASAAAVTHQEHGDPFPQMIWPTNYNRLAAATMFTLFFAGDAFAPTTMVDGEPVQHFLQGHYIRAMQQVASYLKDEPNVLGYDALNEPSNGYAGLEDLRGALFPAPLGWFMSGFQGMQLGAGHSLDVPFFASPMVLTRVDRLNPNRVSAWQSPEHDVWRREGVWDIDERSGEARLLRPDHFARTKSGEPVDFMRDFMAPFFERYKRGIHEVHPDAVIFAEPFIDPNKPVHDPAPPSVTGDRYAWAPHYYDAMTLVLKRARPWVALDIEIELPVFGEAAADAAIRRNLAHVRKCGESLGGRPGGVPVLVGETGIAMDLDRDGAGMAKAYKDGDFSSQIRVLDRTMRALEANLLSFTLWNYSARNSNKRGDLWNDEDLSLFSRDQQDRPAREDIHSGGRALQAAVRPYPMKTRGTPESLAFDPLSPERPFRYTFTSSPSDDPADAPTVIFVPAYQYPNGVLCNVSDGTITRDEANQVIYYRHDLAQHHHTVTLTHKPAA